MITPSRNRRAAPRASLWVLVVAAMLGCAGRPSEPTPKAPTERSELTEADRLSLAVAELEPEEDVLGAIPASVRRPFAEFIERLPDEDRTRIASDVDLARTEPVLHLLAGGTSPAALVALSTSSRGAEELVRAARVAGTDLTELIGPVAEMTRRAARATLREYAPRLELSEVPTESFEIADAAARTLGRGDLAVLVARVRVDRHDDPRAHLWLAARLARRLRVEDGHRDLGVATAAAGAERLGPEIAEVGRLLALAASGLGGLAPDADATTRTRAARDLLALERPDDALRALGALGGEVPALDRAALRARVLVGDASCPGMPPVARTPELCAAVWSRSPAAREAVRLMEAAWAAGGSRSREGVEAYLGFVHVLPLSYSGQESTARASVARRLEALDAALSELPSPTPTQKGIALFSRTLAAGHAAADDTGQLGALSQEAARGLEEAARALSAEELQDRVAAAAVLGAASLLVRDRDIGPLLERVPAGIDAELQPSRAALAAVSGLAWGSPDAARRAREGLGAAMLDTDSALERSRTILLMAEIDAALEPDARRLDVLGKVGQQLAADPTSGSLALRGALVAAGVRARAGEFAEARSALGTAAGAAPTSLLAWLVASAGTVLAANDGLPSDAPNDRANGGDREPVDDLLALAHIEGAPPSGAPAAWVRAWAEALGHRRSVERCGAAATCRRRVERRRKLVDVEGLAGRTAHRLLERETLVVSGTELRLDYDPPRGIVPVVRVDLALLPLPVPSAYRAKED